MQKKRLAKFSELRKKLIVGILSAERTTWALQAMTIAGLKFPEVERKYLNFVDEAWSALWDHFYVGAGTVLDRAPQAASLLSVSKLARTLVEDNAESIAVLDELDARISQQSEQLWKQLLEWRNRAIAHNDASVDKLELYARNRMHVSDCEKIISSFFDELNEISYVALGDVLYGRGPGLQIMIDETVAIYERLNRPS